MSFQREAIVLLASDYDRVARLDVSLSFAFTSAGDMLRSLGAIDPPDIGFARVINVASILARHRAGNRAIGFRVRVVGLYGQRRVCYSCSTAEAYRHRGRLQS